MDILIWELHGLKQGLKHSQRDIFVTFYVSKSMSINQCIKTCICSYMSKANFIPIPIQFPIKSIKPSKNHNHIQSS